MELPIRSEDVFATFGKIWAVRVQLSDQKVENPMTNLFIYLRPECFGMKSSHLDLKKVGSSPLFYKVT